MDSTPSTSLGDLSNEILSLVVEELNEVARASLFKLQLVSKQFDALAIPISYQSVTLNTLVFPSPGCEELDLLCRDNILTNIRAHTRHLSIREGLNRDSVFKFVSSMTQFRTLRWSNWSPTPPAEKGMSIPAFFGALHQAWPNFELHVEDLAEDLAIRVARFPGSYYTPGGLPTSLLLDRIPQALLSAHLVSFEANHLSHVADSLSEPRNSTLYTLLAACPRLRALTLEGELHPFHMPIYYPAKKLPPLEYLSLRHYDWTCSERGLCQGLCQGQWDLSRVTRLELYNTQTRYLFAHVPPETFTHLRSLKMDPGEMPAFCERRLVMGKHRQDAAKLHIALDHIHALEELSMTCWLSELPLSTITRHGSTLRSLKLYDHQWFNEFSSRTNRNKDYLETIRESCPHLTTLSLDSSDFDIPRKTILEVLTTFRNLRNLTLQVPNLVRCYRLNVEIIDTDLAAVMEHHCDLVFSKQGAPFEKIIFVVSGYTAFFEGDSDCHHSVRQGARIFFCTDDGLDGPVCREEVQPCPKRDNQERLWELDAA